MPFKKLSEHLGGQSITDCATLCVFLSSYAFTALEVCFGKKKKEKKGFGNFMD